ncbi:hypothetical protein AK812_SmicGene8305 [Symbiodinium microadriaticum]|uniref:Uncharacterized protein n=1 Tax=Symbiodinium microadriaticum TaxID=2951 RepID=A0A1Q9ELD3_SYMMI|nr:hypothetical protein AK812_SmicGene8305 [Symbiodinium microadriaticum]
MLRKPSLPALSAAGRPRTEPAVLSVKAKPGEWAGQEELVVPAIYATGRPDTVTLCVGYAGLSEHESPPVRPALGTEYDFLELLYAKDQEGTVVQVVPYESEGITPAVFWTCSFQPPRGTTSLTPFAAFKLRGVWQGDPIEWDPSKGSQEMDWFATMPIEQRRLLAEPGRALAPQPSEVDSQTRPRREKEGEEWRLPRIGLVPPGSRMAAAPGGTQPRPPPAAGVGGDGGRAAIALSQSPGVPDARSQDYGPGGIRARFWDQTPH